MLPKAVEMENQQVVTLNTHNTWMAIILCYFTEFGKTEAHYLKVVKLDPYCL